MNFEPSLPPPAPPPPLVQASEPPLAPSAAGATEALLLRVQRLQRRQLWWQGALVGLAAAVVLLLAAGFAASVSVPLARGLFLLAPLGFAAGLSYFGIVRAVVEVGDARKTARLLGERLPELSLDLLAAVELRQALEQGATFSPELAGAFLEHADVRARAVDARRALEPKALHRAGYALAGALLVCVGLAALYPQTLKRGVRAALASTAARAEPPRREPINGDVELTYRYPAYTGLSPRTVEGTNGEVNGPAGTEVQLKTRADRVVTRAQLVVNDKPVPLQVSGGRELVGSFVLDKPGSYHFAFLGARNEQVAQGPDLPVNVEADGPPQVRLTAPVEDLEIDPDQVVTLKFEASDDYGLTDLALVFRAPGKEERRLPLSHDEGRRTQGQYRWDLKDVALSPGQEVRYYLEAHDNDAVGGKKKGASRTQVLRLYSAAEHRREAARKAERLWDRLVLHLADRLEGPERGRSPEVDRVLAAQSVDAAGLQLCQDLRQTAQEISRERDAPEELAAALANISESLRGRTAQTQDARRFFARMVKVQGQDAEAGKVLAAAVVREISEAERDVLYLESMLDRLKLSDLQDLAKQLQQDRRELASMIEKYQQTKDEKVKESVLQDIKQMRERINELMQRMSELAKGIRDEHLNQEALKDMMEERDMSSALDEIEKLMREGKADEALAKLQQLSMQMDEMMNNLDDAEERSSEEQFPELAQKFQEFMDDLKKTGEAQRQVADQTREVKDRYKQQTQQRLKQRGQALREELLRKAEEISRDYQSLSKEPMGSRAERPLEEAQSELSSLKSALKVEDYDLAAEAATRAERASQELAAYGDQQKRLDEVFQNPPDARKQSRELSEKLKRDAQKVQEISQKLRQLFPPPGSMLSEEDRQQLKSLSQEQKGLEKRAEGLRRQMDEMSQMAPLFGEDAQDQMQKISERMGDAAQKMEARDPGRGHGEQKAALEQLEQFEKQMQQSSKGKGKGKGGLPLPMMAGRREGWGNHNRDKVELPDEDQFQAPKEFRKDLLDAMKQGAPDKYRDQVKRYYEELVK